MKDYNVMIDRKNFFDQPTKNDLKSCDNIRKIATDADPKTIKQMNFTGNLSRAEGAIRLFIIEEANKQNSYGFILF